MLKDGILRDQMNYAEQKIHEVTYCLNTSYRDDLIKARPFNVGADMIRENKEYLIYQEALACALSLVKNELRRSFKENGFYDLGPNEFTDYVSGRTKLFINITREYLVMRYPTEGMIISIRDRFSRAPEAFLEVVTTDVYLKAKQIKNTAELKLDATSKEYDKDMLEFERM
jgi:hypothetical protein